MFLLLVLLLSLSTTLYITLLFYLFFVVCDGFAMAFCPFHSPGFGECAQIHLPRKVYLRAPFRDPGSAQARPGSFRRRPGRALDPCRPCLPELSGTRLRPAPAQARRCWSFRPRPCPRLDRPPAGKTRRRALPLCTPASGVPPDTLRRESLPCTRPNRRSWPPRSPRALTGIRENPRVEPRIFNTSLCLILSVSWLVIPLHIRRGSRAP